MNSKFCGQCGAENDGNNKFCVNCGAPLEASGETKSDQYFDPYERSFGESAGRHEEGAEEVIYTSIVPKSIALCIFLTIITFGIYGLFWMYRLNNEVNELAQDPIAPGGGMVIFLCFVTLGFYGLFWLYKMGQKCDMIKQVNGSSGILYLILGIIGLGIVSYALIQDTINKVLE